MLWLFAALLIGLAIIFGIHRSLSTSVDTRNPFVGVSKRILLVTSHPDDECMFFSPTILNLQRMGHEVLLLCLSIGGHYGLGKRRIKELYASGSILGLLADNITILDDKRLLDGPDEHWSKEVIEELVSKHLQKKSVDAVITFDEGGVSGHPNHIAVNQGIRYMQTSGKLKGVPVFTLETTDSLRKYISILDIPWSYKNASILFVCTWSEVLRGQSAMLAHWSQMVWFRWLYIIFSRYMVINTLKQIEER